MRYLRLPFDQVVDALEGLPLNVIGKSLPWRGHLWMQLSAAGLEMQAPIFAAYEGDPRRIMFYQSDDPAELRGFYQGVGFGAVELQWKATDAPQA